MRVMQHQAQMQAHLQMQHAQNHHTQMQHQKNQHLPIISEEQAQMQRLMQQQQLMSMESQLMAMNLANGSASPAMDILSEFTSPSNSTPPTPTLPSMMILDSNSPFFNYADPNIYTAGMTLNGGESGMEAIPFEQSNFDEFLQFTPSPNKTKEECTPHFRPTSMSEALS